MSEPKWLALARGEIGVHETPGAPATARIVEYDSCTSLRATSDEVPWCSSFVCWCLERAGLRSTLSAAARSWLKWGVPCEAKVGAVVVFSRGSNPAAGHVAIVNKLPEQGYVEVVGGNQGDKVSIARFPVSRVLGYRWPADVPTTIPIEERLPEERCGTCEFWHPIQVQDPDRQKFFASTVDGDCTAPLPVELPACFPRHTVGAYTAGCPVWSGKGSKSDA